MVRIHDDGSLDDEELVREGGVFVSRNGGHEVHEDEMRASDDYIEDPGTGDGVPGTVDDLPYDFGLENANAADQLLESSGRGHGVGSKVGHTGADDDSEPPELGGPEERELWKKQRGLIQEASEHEAHYAGLDEDRIAAVDAALGEDAAEVLPDSPEGKSATGAS